jgi:hypothetical protein
VIPFRRALISQASACRSYNKFPEKFETTILNSCGAGFPGRLSRHYAALLIFSELWKKEDTTRKLLYAADFPGYSEISCYPKRYSNRQRLSFIVAGVRM